MLLGNPTFKFAEYLTTVHKGNIDYPCNITLNDGKYYMEILIDMHDVQQINLLSSGSYYFSGNILTLIDSNTTQIKYLRIGNKLFPLQTYKGFRRKVFTLNDENKNVNTIAFNASNKLNCNCATTDENSTTKEFTLGIYTNCGSWCVKREWWIDFTAKRYKLYFGRIILLQGRWKQKGATIILNNKYTGFDYKLMIDGDTLCSSNLIKIRSCKFVLAK